MLYCLVTATKMGFVSTRQQCRESAHAGIKQVSLLGKRDVASYRCMITSHDVQLTLTKIAATYAPARLKQTATNTDIHQITMVITAPSKRAALPVLQMIAVLFKREALAEDPRISGNSSKVTEQNIASS